LRMGPSALLVVMLVAPTEVRCEFLKSNLLWTLKYNRDFCLRAQGTNLCRITFTIGWSAACVTIGGSCPTEKVFPMATQNGLATITRIRLGTTATFLKNRSPTLNAVLFLLQTRSQKKTRQQRRTRSRTPVLQFQLKIWRHNLVRL